MAAGMVFAEPFSQVVDITPDAQDQMRPPIAVLGTLALSSEAPDGAPVTGLSGLAWDEDEQLLYAVSDKGRLIHLRPRLAAERLVGVEFVGSFPLLGAKGAPLRDQWRDAEGLVVLDAANGVAGDSELLVSFERYPRIARYSTRGHLLGGLDLPSALADPDRYRSPNKALESLADLSGVGVVTAPETAMRDGALSLWALDGRRWDYAPSEYPGASVVAMEALADRRLLVLERAFVSPLWPMVIVVRAADLAADMTAKVSTLAVLHGADGWRLDNFEGLTRHTGNRFFMVSDDNGNGFQRTLLAYFQLPPT